jgi:hypothetical protein
MLECRQLARLDLVNNTLDAGFRRHVGLDGGDAVLGADMFEQLVRAVLVPHDGKDISFRS